MQGGFYHIHEHSLEILSHKCVHDGEHDQVFDEDCSVCEFLANVHYDVSAPFNLISPKYQNAFLVLHTTEVVSKPYFELNNRGPPSIS